MNNRVCYTNNNENKIFGEIINPSKLTSLELMNLLESIMKFKDIQTTDFNAFITSYTNLIMGSSLIIKFWENPILETIENKLGYIFVNSRGENDFDYSIEADKSMVESLLFTEGKRMILKINFNVDQLFIKDNDEGNFTEGGEILFKFLEYVDMETRDLDFVNNLNREYNSIREKYPLNNIGSNVRFFETITKMSIMSRLFNKIKSSDNIIKLLTKIRLSKKGMEILNSTFIDSLEVLYELYKMYNMGALNTEMFSSDIDNSKYSSLIKFFKGIWREEYDASKIKSKYIKKKIKNDVKLNVIVCCSPTGVIGDSNPEEGSNGLLWHSSEELKCFKEITKGNVLIFGTNTAKYVPIEKMKKNRDIYVWDGSITLESIIEKYKGTGKEIFICGGAYTYEYFIKKYYIDNFYISILNNSVKIKDAKKPLHFYLNREDINDLINDPNRGSSLVRYHDFDLITVYTK